MSAVDRVSMRVADVFTPPEDRLTGGALAERVRSMIPPATVLDEDTRDPMGRLVYDLITYLDAQDDS